MNNKKRRIRKLPFVILALVLLLCIFLIVFLTTVAPKLKISGEWKYKDDTVYTFKIIGGGSLHTMNNDYPFDYKIKNNTVIIDFESDDAKDCKYEYKVENDKLILEGKEGTVGGTYELTKSK